MLCSKRLLGIYLKPTICSTLCRCSDWAFVFGGVAMLMSALPSFRNFRLFSFLALVATTFTAWVRARAAQRCTTLHSADSASPPPPAPSRPCWLAGVPLAGIGSQAAKDSPASQLLHSPACPLCCHAALYHVRSTWW